MPVPCSGTGRDRKSRREVQRSASGCETSDVADGGCEIFVAVAGVAEVEVRGSDRAARCGGFMLFRVRARSGRVSRRAAFHRRVVSVAFVMDRVRDASFVARLGDRCRRRRVSVATGRALTFDDRVDEFNRLVHRGIVDAGHGLVRFLVTLLATPLRVATARPRRNSRRERCHRSSVPRGAVSVAQVGS